MKKRTVVYEVRDKERDYVISPWSNSNSFWRRRGDAIAAVKTQVNRGEPFELITYELQPVELQRQDITKDM